MNGDATLSLLHLQLANKAAPILRAACANKQAVRIVLYVGADGKPAPMQIKVKD